MWKWWFSLFVCVFAFRVCARTRVSDAASYVGA